VFARIPLFFLHTAHPKVSFKSTEGVSSPSARPISCWTTLRDFRQSNYIRSTATADPYISIVNRQIPRPLRWSCKSLSSNGIERSEHKQRREVKKLIQMGMGCLVPYSSDQPKPSRREDIFKGLANWKQEAANDAAKSSSCTKNNG